MSKLVNGNVPKGSMCPFSGEGCIPECPVNGKSRDRDFSCALARGLDLAECALAEPDYHAPVNPPESEDPWEDYQERHSRPARRGVKKFRERNCC